MELVECGLFSIVYLRLWQAQKLGRTGENFITLQLLLSKFAPFDLTETRAGLRVGATGCVMPHHKDHEIMNLASAMHQMPDYQPTDFG